jgi:predicted O-methyltransferase YrrM
MIDFEALGPLHDAPDALWSVPLINAVPRPNGPTQSEIEILLLMWALVLMLKPLLVIETGTDTGAMARALGCAVQANGAGEVITAEVNAELIDHARALCAGLPVQVHHGPALDLPIERADLLFIDSSYESRRQELARVKPGAVAVLHDICHEPSIGLEALKYPQRIRVFNPRGFAIIQP